MIRALALCCGVVLFAGCGGPKTSPGPCDVDPPAPECTQQCDPTPGAANTCPSGYHCGPDGFCFASCTQGGSECGPNARCTSDGECVPSDGDAAPPGPDADCPNVNFTATAITPTIQFLIDKSGSMGPDPGNGGGPYGSYPDKYTALEDVLVGAGGGIVGQYQAAVYFGATLYSQTGSACPNLIPGVGGTGRALNNLTAVRTLINNNNPGGGTPTGPSLESTYMEMVATPPPPDSPPIIILATDGEPYTCPNNNDNAAGRNLSIAAAQAAFTAGIRTFVLGLSVSTATDQHLQRVANAGVGQDPVSGTAPYYPADNPTALAAAFDAIIGGVVSCDLTLDGDITPSQASSGEVRLNGNLLTYGTDWTLMGTNVITLTGQACTDLMNSTNPTVTAEFPCGAVIVE
jgi:hypothetical protein